MFTLKDERNEKVKHYTLHSRSGYAYICLHKG